MNSFKIPKNYTPPEGVKEGETFRDIATFKMKDGEMTLISVGEDEAMVGGKEKPKGMMEVVKEKFKPGDTEEEL